MPGIRFIYIKGKTQVEITSEIGITKQAVFDRKIRALARLRRLQNETPVHITANRANRAGI